MKSRDDVPSASRTLLEPLRRAPIAISSPGEADPERARHLPEIAAMVRGAPRLRAAAEARRRSRAYGLAAAAVVALAVGTALQWTRGGGAEAGAPEPGTTVVEGRLNVDHDAPLLEGSRFVGEAAIETPRDASARLVTESGVEVVLSHASRARLHPAGRRQRVDLAQGEVTLSVPKLSVGDSVAVVTPNATVTVHGTRFSVSYDATATRPSTCVKVTEGIVSVDRGTKVERLGAGQSSGCDALERPLPAERNADDETRPLPAANAPTTLPASRESGSRDGARRPAAPSDSEQSTLEQENQLLLAGLAAERRHSDAEARAALHQLLARYPRSPLVEEAKTALARIDRRH